MDNLKLLLDVEVEKRNDILELSEDTPDPLMIAKEQQNEFAILTCALFAYGNAKQIVKFLQKLPFDLIDRPVSEQTIRTRLDGLKYRFQTNEDLVQWFLLINKIHAEKGGINFLNSSFLNGYKKNKDVIEGIHSILNSLKPYLNGYSSSGLSFLIGQEGTNSPLKRWNMFLRWMVRRDILDLGWWSNDVSTADLIIPLDTHTFKLGKKLGLITRKTYDLKSAIELTESLKKFDIDDPVKYDFALYRIGQEKIDI